MQLSGVFVLFVAILVSRILNEKGYRKLSPEEKLRLMDGFSTIRIFSIVPLLLLIALFWFLSTQTETRLQMLTVGYFKLLILYVLTRSFLNQKKLLQLRLPKAYQQTFALSQAVSLAGVAWFFFTLLNKS